MNEPISMPSHPFQGKSANHHPHWQNEPLRLTRAQIADPRLVLDDFFECYHLKEVRETLWPWLVEVLSSPHGISQNALERSNHIYFYEKVEALIEACWVIRNRTEDSGYPDAPGSGQHSLGNGNTAMAEGTPSDTSHFFNKDIPLVETATTDPKGVIRRIFYEESYEILLDKLGLWYNMAIACDNSVYDDADQREQLTRFYEALRPLLYGLYELDQKDTGHRVPLMDRLPEALQKDLAAVRRIHTTYQGASAAPAGLITDFFAQVPIGYIEAEMADWLAAGISYEGRYSEDMTKPEVLETYRNIKCLIRAARELVSSNNKAPGAGKGHASGATSPVCSGVPRETENVSP